MSRGDCRQISGVGIIIEQGFKGECVTGQEVKVDERVAGVFFHQSSGGFVGGGGRSRKGVFRDDSWE